MDQRWHCKELIPYDLIPDRELFTVFVKSPKAQDISTTYKNFKSIKTKSRKKLLCKYSPSPIKCSNSVTLHRPRYTEKLPESSFLNILRKNKSSKQNSESSNYKNEMQIEELIRNRKEIVLPTLEKSKAQFNNIRERIINTKSRDSRKNIAKHESYFQSIKQKIRYSNYNAESEMTYSQKQPIRKWYSRNDIIVSPKRQKSQTKGNIKESVGFADDDCFKKINLIGEIFDECKQEILKLNM
ncbi:hypothetical protein SteCoe_32301 [Stentor coeruleus]|uniref:Uncharacterized protein n=1 Tax=Stentor coeruleus TaxID=5963 RepID=A0A1R2AZA2_9CILI|nr:hypothetical protein SteCoe_32301 [Stentor coeruleus]